MVKFALTFLFLLNQLRYFLIKKSNEDQKALFKSVNITSHRVGGPDPTAGPKSTL